MNPRTRLFTDQQVTEACGLHVDNLRQLITWKAVVPAQRGGGRGKIRLWTEAHVRRISVTATLFNAGLSLKLSHTIAYCIPEDHWLDIYEPHVLAVSSPEIQKLGWYDRGKSKVTINPEDCYIDIINREFIFLRANEKIFRSSFNVEEQQIIECFGRLNSNQTRFISRVPVHQIYEASEHDPAVVVGLASGSADPRRTLAKWEDKHTPVDLIDPKSLVYEHAVRFDLDLANAAYTNPIVKEEINISLGLRVAMRRVLGLPTEYPL